MPVRRASAFAVLLFALAGCGEPDVRTYTAPKPHPAPADFGFRILGAMVPAEEPVWFFKMTGPATDVNAQEAAFDAFLASVTFPDGPGKPPKWTVPEGVKVGPPKEFRFATLIFGGDNPAELSVSEAKGGKDANLTRWAGQVGTTDTAKATAPIKVGGLPAVKVTMTGPKNPGAGGMMMRR
jgi:hypothetical protein